jgi:hypothetical protein
MKRAERTCHRPPALNTTTPDEEAVMSTGNSTVTYKDIPDNPGYRVGDDGSVWSWRGRLKPFRANKQRPYLRVCLRNRRLFRVHVLVLEAFVGPRPPGMVCCHGDGDPTNNALSNLRWDTPQANHADRVKHGRPCAPKLTADQVREIRARRAAGSVTYAQLASEYGVKPSVVFAAAIRRTWANIT